MAKSKKIIWHECCGTIKGHPHMSQCPELERLHKKALPKKAEPEEGYEYVRAIVDCEGELVIEYKLRRNMACRLGHDENVGSWSDAEIVKLVCDLIEAKPGEVEVQRE